MKFNYLCEIQPNGFIHLCACCFVSYVNVIPRDTRMSPLPHCHVTPPKVSRRHGLSVQVVPLWPSILCVSMYFVEVFPGDGLPALIRHYSCQGPRFGASLGALFGEGHLLCNSKTCDISTHPAQFGSEMFSCLGVSYSGVHIFFTFRDNCIFSAWASSCCGPWPVGAELGREGSASPPCGLPCE